LGKQFPFETFELLVFDLKYLWSEFDMDYMLLNHYICIITIWFYVICGLSLDLELEFKYAITRLLMWC